MTTIKYWHKQMRSWVVYDLDANGNQLGNARYYPNKTAMTLGESCA